MSSPLVEIQNKIRSAGEPAREAAGLENAVVSNTGEAKGSLSAVTQSLGEIAAQLQGIKTALEQNAGHIQQAQSVLDQSRGAASEAIDKADTVRGIVQSTEGVPGAGSLVVDAANFQENTTRTQEAVGQAVNGYNEPVSKASALAEQIGSIGIGIESLTSDMGNLLATTQQAEDQATQTAAIGSQLAGSLEGFTIVGIPGGV